MPDALIVDAVRSPIGKKNGTLAKIRGDDLAAQVLNALVARSDLDPGEVEDVQMGCVTQIGEQAWNIGRMAVMAAGWPVEVCGSTVGCGHEPAIPVLEQGSKFLTQLRELDQADLD